MNYQFIAEHAAIYPVTRQCRVLGVAVSGYYAWRKDQSKPRQQADEQLLGEIQQI
jgi:putative transposase